MTFYEAQKLADKLPGCTIILTKPMFDSLIADARKQSCLRGYYITQVKCVIVSTTKFIQEGSHD